MSAYLITPLGSLVARDGRPFGANPGARMRLTPWLHPSVAAGSFRTMLGKQLGGFTRETIDKLMGIPIAGPLPWLDGQPNGQLFFPAPKDIMLRADGAAQNWLSVRPMTLRDGEGTDLPLSLTPAALGDSVSDFKAALAPAWWQASQMFRWLLDELPAVPGEEEEWRGNGFMESPLQDLRTHVEMEDATGTGIEGRLFQTAGFQFRHDVRLALRVGGALPEHAAHTVSGIHPFGGERRLASWDAAGIDPWQPPKKVADKLRGSKYVRMILATPAIFRDGWKPGWLDETLTGKIPETDVRVRLVSACIDRWGPLSGWSLDARDSGEKPVRRLVPAGSVYFLECEGEQPFPVDNLWLQPVSDRTQARQDGFGLALWGIWNQRRVEGEHKS